jgi:perosamine synthetase
VVTVGDSAGPVAPAALRRAARRHLPVVSPLPLAAFAAAARTLLEGDAHAELTALLCREYQADGVRLTASGTAALELAIRTALSDGPPIVALPAYTCFDVATATVGAGAGILLYDVDPDTLALDLESLDDAFRAGARAAVIAPLYGVPVDWDSAAALARAHGATLIEDAAQGHGGRWRGRPLGALGALSVLSFGRGKGWTGGAGGALLWRGAANPLPAGHPDDDASGAPGAHGALRNGAGAHDLTAVPDAESLRTPSVRAGATVLAVAAAQWLLGRPALYSIPAAMPWLRLGDTVYRAPAPPRAMPAAAAALALATRLPAMREAAARRDRAAALRTQLAEAPGGAAATIRTPAGGEPGWLRLPVRLPAPAASDLVRELRHLGVSAAYPATLAELRAVRERQVGPVPRLTGAAALVRELVTLPTHGQLRDGERRDLVRAVTAAAARHVRA